MKKRLYVIIVTLFISSVQLFSQQSLVYYYDNSGNRIERSLYIGGQKKSEKADDQSDQNKEIAEKINDVVIKMYPNPTEGKLILEFENLNEFSSVEVKVFDINGKSIINRKILEYRTQIDITNNAPGSYFLLIKIDNSISRWKIIKR